LTDPLSQISGNLTRARQCRTETQEQLRRLVETVAQCGHSPALVDAINERQRELDDSTRRLFAYEPDSVSSEIARIRQFVTERQGNIRELLSADVRGPDDPDTGRVPIRSTRPKV
jgi:hypothetical protein